jgi:hypothetical protein
MSPATGAARLVTFEPTSLAANRAPATGATPEARARAFFRDLGLAFGVRDADDELAHPSTRADALGGSHVSFRQRYRGLPVFGAVLRVHFDKHGKLYAANGSFVPDIEVDPVPDVTGESAERAARALYKGRVALETVNRRLLVFRTHLARGIPGTNHLAWEVELRGRGVWEHVYVDAHDAIVLDRIQLLHDAIQREVYDGSFDEAGLVWQEGDPVPYGEAEVDHLIDYTLDTYNLFSSLTNGTFRSWDGVDGTMPAVANTTSLFCPNAAWFGNRAAFCTEVTGDDVVAHEWGHAYTDSTHALIYQWQSGALNESYSDIWGEVVDLLNGAGLDEPAPPRAADGCSTFGGEPQPQLDVIAPAGLAGSYTAAGSTFDPEAASDLTAELELADDGVGVNSDGCEALVGFTPGRIALIDRGNCEFAVKAQNAEAAGAVAVVVANYEDGVIRMSGSPASGIPAVMITQDDGQTLRAALPGVTLRLRITVASDPSLRWLIGDDSPAFGGPIRDMWNPSCFDDASKVSDPTYTCSSEDQGGVHSNSAIPNHTFSLLADGGSFNGFTVEGIGLTRATRIYWRAQSVYQVPTTNFPEHADLLALACQDLVGATLYAPSTDSPDGAVSTETISIAHCDELQKAIDATELAAVPPCEYEPLLAPDPPPVCESGPQQLIFGTEWESGLDGWTTGTREVANPETFDTPDWAVVDMLPDERPGHAVFVASRADLGDCESDDESGVLYLESPDITLPTGVADLWLRFDHWVAIEPLFDGGNVKVQVNGGEWFVVPGSVFTFNPYPGFVTNSSSNTNPLAGEEAFTGTNAGSVMGSWGESQVDLTGLAAPGDVLRFRFEMGLDGCNGAVGWYVDLVELYSCNCTGGTLPGAWYPDLDGDRYGDPALGVIYCDPPDAFVHRGTDCNDADPDAWAVPGEATALAFGTDKIAMTWSPPSNTGGNVLLHDMLRATGSAEFGTAECVEIADQDAIYESLADPPPGTLWSFLPRAVNGCTTPGTLGTTSAGSERNAPSCR